MLKFISHFTSVDGTTDNGSLPASGKVVPQAPDEEVKRFCYKQNLPFKVVEEQSPSTTAVAV